MTLNKSISVFLVIVSILLVSGCEKTDDPNNGGNEGEDHKKYSVMVSCDPSEGGTATGGGTYNEGTSCTVTATAATGYTFVHWTENGEEVSTGPGYSFNVTFDRTLVAHFTYNGGGEDPKYYWVNLRANPEEGGSVWGDGRYEEGQSCTIEAAAGDYYTFVNWTDANGNMVSTDLSYTFEVERTCTFVANFSHNSIGGHEYVDLGLPSGNLWATCNVGADNPEDFGYYFAWGETERKTIYGVEDYEYAVGDDLFHPQLTKYCYLPSYGHQGFTDDLSILLSEDDAAAANWGDGWHIPTKEDWEELLYNTTLSWITLNNVGGLCCTGTTGNYIFIPPAGFYSDKYLWYAGASISYLSSSLYKGEGNEPWGDGPDCAWGFGGDDSGGGMALGFRYAGRSVRAVCAKPQ